MKGKYAVVEVDKDNVRMSKFIKEKLNCQFEDGRAFYEATENEEDFLYYKKILRAEEEKVISHYARKYYSTVSENGFRGHLINSP